jgi:heat shock protein HslJ
MKSWPIVLGTVFTCGCVALSPNKEPPPKPFTATKWELIMDIPPAGELPYVRFGDGIMQGFGGCSRFGSRYVQDTVGARAIAFGRIEVDRRLCDPAVRASEARLLEVLQAVSSYLVVADVLTMTGSGGTLRFRAADAAAATPATSAPSVTAVATGPTLAGTRWRGVVDGGVDEAATPWLEFVDGRVAGYTGCNMLSGPWRFENGQFLVGPLVTTKRACAGAGSEVERRVLSALGERGRVTREGQRLVASGPGGERFEFAEVR